MEHKFHIEHVEALQSIFQSLQQQLVAQTPKKKEPVGEALVQSLKLLNETKAELDERIEQCCEDVRQTLISQQQKAQLAMAAVRTIAQQGSFEGGRTFRPQVCEMIRQLVQFSEEDDLFCLRRAAVPKLEISKDFLSFQLQRALEHSVSTHCGSQNIQSTSQGFPKILYWFEWGKRRLNVYDITSNTTSQIELKIHFKIPAFSRSVMTPDCKIYLMGGEEPEQVSKKEVYLYDYLVNDQKLHQKASMPNKKFDLTLCFLNGFVYCLCGKDGLGEVVATCDRYDVALNVWEPIASANRRRYAASAAGCTNNRIYLIGGRNEHNTMVPEIECYAQEEDAWTVLQLKNGGCWTPVEVCGSLQVSASEVLIFGGSDNSIKDTNQVVSLNFKDLEFKSQPPLQKAQVFVSAPFLVGSFVYAIGNEYYMKFRNLNRYSIEKKEWS